MLSLDFSFLGKGGEDERLCPERYQEFHRIHFALKSVAWLTDYKIQDAVTKI